MTLLAALFGALICFAFITTPVGRDVIGCQALAALNQFFFLSTLTWSNSMAISIYRSLHSLRLASSSKRTFILYNLYSFGLPFVLTLLAFILSKVKSIDFKSKIYDFEVICFLFEKIVIYSLFLVPVYILIISNIIIGVAVMVKVARSGKVGATKDRNRLKKSIICCLKVSFCLGLGWVLLFVALIHPSIWQVMQVFVELQGVFIVAANIVGLGCIRTVKSWTETYTSTTSHSVSSNHTQLTAVHLPTFAVPNNTPNLTTTNC